MRGLIGGVLTGGLVSLVGLGTASLVSEPPAGVTPPEAPLVDAPQVDPVAPDVAQDSGSDADVLPADIDGPSTPVGSVTIQEPQAPELPEGEASITDQSAPVVASIEPDAPRADTDPLDEPSVVAIEGTLQAPDAPQETGIATGVIEPVLPNPQSQAPQTPVTEADLSVSTAPAAPQVVVIEGEGDTAPDVDVSDPEAAPQDDFFVVDLGADAAGDTQTEAADTSDAITDTGTGTDAAPEPTVEIVDAPLEQPEDEVLAAIAPEAVAPRLQLQGEGNVLPGGNVTGVTVRRPTTQENADEAAAPASVNALETFAASTAEVGNTPLLSIVLIDDGSMSAASAALAGLPFPVTIALAWKSPSRASLAACPKPLPFWIWATAGCKATAPRLNRRWISSRRRGAGL